MITPLIVPLLCAQAMGQAAGETESAALIHSRAWIPATVGTISLIAGASFIVLGVIESDRAASLPSEEAAAVARTDASFNLVGGIALGSMGGLVLGVALVMFSWAPPKGVHVSAVPTPGGGLVHFTLLLP